MRISTALTYFYMVESTRWGTVYLGSRCTYFFIESVDISAISLPLSHTLLEVSKTWTITTYLLKQLS